MSLISHLTILFSLSFIILFPDLSYAQLRLNYYANICPNVENIVREAVVRKHMKSFATVPATLRLFFHDCFVQGCDASVMVASTPDNKAEKDYPDNLSLAGDGFDTVVGAKAAIDAIPSCANKVSCADILAMATRDVIALGGGPRYEVELGRLDGLSSTAASVEGKLPQSTFNLDQLIDLFAVNGLDLNDMIALSGAHTLGFSHCDKFYNRIYNFSAESPVDPTLHPQYAAQLQGQCPRSPKPNKVVPLDPVTSFLFDNMYYLNLQHGKGLLTSDQVLFTDPRSRPIVNDWADDSTSSLNAFVSAITKMGRVGVKTGNDGNIRRDCGAFN